MTFAPGEIEQTISLPIVDDAIREDPDPVLGLDESFLVGLEFGDDYRFKNSGVVEVLILDNDGDDAVTPDPPGVTVSPSALTVPEGTTVTYTVRLDSEPTGNVTLTPSSDNPGRDLFARHTYLHDIELEHRADGDGDGGAG